MIVNVYAAKLQKNHRLILGCLDEIYQSMRSYNQIKPVLRTFQNILLSHFGEQNKDFFDRIRPTLDGDREKMKILEFLIYNLDDIKIKTLAFLDEYPADISDTHPHNFPQNFMEYSEEVRVRLKLEEDYLFGFLSELLN